MPHCVVDVCVYAWYLFTLLFLYDTWFCSAQILYVSLVIMNEAHGAGIYGDR